MSVLAHLEPRDLISGYAVRIDTTTDGQYLTIAQPDPLAGEDASVWMTLPQILELYDYLTPLVNRVRGFCVPGHVGHGAQEGE